MSAGTGLAHFASMSFLTLKICRFAVTLTHYFCAVLHMTPGLFLARNIFQKRKKKKNLSFLFMSQMSHTDLSKKCPMSAPTKPTALHA